MPPPDQPTVPAEPASEHLRRVQETAWLLLAMAERLQQHFAARAVEFGLSAAQAKVLVALQPGESAPMRALAVRLEYDPSNLTGLVDRLEARGTVERRPDPADRRVKALVLTEAGERTRQDFQRRLTRDAGPLARLSPSQIDELRALLQVALARE